MSGVCVELRRRPPPQRGERKNGPKTAPLRHDRLHHPLRQSPKLSNSRILLGYLERTNIANDEIFMGFSTSIDNVLDDVAQGAGLQEPDSLSGCPQPSTP